MSKIWTGENLANDPWATTTDDISEYYHVQSTGWGGSYKAVTAPSVNFPVVTPARIFVELPMVIDRSDLTGSRPIKITDTTIGSTMTRVATAPTGNEYRIPPASSIRRDVIEVSSTKVGNVLDFDYYGEGSVFNAKEYNTFRQYFALLSIQDNYTISDTDYLGQIEVAHTSTTAKITVTLPTVADNEERRIIIRNTYAGYTLVDGEGSETISFRGNSLSSIILLQEDDYVDIISNGTEWKIIHCNITRITGWINRSDWTNVVIGCAFTYDNKSAAVDLTGQHFYVADGGSQQKAVIIDDGGGTGTSGTMYIFSMIDTGTSHGVWTNNQTCTCGNGGYTFDINETSGSSKNVNYYFQHYNSLSYLYIQKRFFISTSPTGSFTNSFEIPLNQCEITNTGALAGFVVFQLSTVTDSFSIHTNGMPICDNGVTVALLTAGDYCYYATYVVTC